MRCLIFLGHGTDAADVKSGITETFQKSCATNAEFTFYPEQLSDCQTGQRRTAAYKRRSKIMSVPASLMMGIFVGIALFFILERSGVVYKWFDKWDQ